MDVFKEQLPSEEDKGNPGDIEFNRSFFTGQEPGGMLQRELPPPSVPACLRTGMCCEKIMLAMSPSQMREAYDNWKNNRPQTVVFQDIDLIYPMLMGTCKGKMNYGGRLKYVYGPCKMLGRDEKNLPLCTIHSIKPRMCLGFPYYEEAQPIRMNAIPNHNGSQYRGCGYNEDKSHGISLKEIQEQLLPLTEDEL